MSSIYIYGNFNPFAYISDEKEHWKSVFQVKKHINQKSLFAFTEKAVPIPLDKINLKKEWTAQQIWDDFNKGYVGELLGKPADYVLIDALSCVIPVREVTDGVYKTRITYSDPMASACEDLVKQKALKVAPKSLRFSEADIKRCVGDFCKKLLEVYDQRQIIIHKANYPQFYIQSEELVHFSPAVANTRAANRSMLKTIYTLFEYYLPSAHFIDMPETAYTRNAKQAFNFGQDYARYVYTSLMMKANPAIAQHQLNLEYTRFFEHAHQVAGKDKEMLSNIQNVVDEYEYKLEIYNQKFRQYEDKFLELYNFIMDTNFESLPWPEGELSFSEFINLKKKYPQKMAKKHSKLWYIFIYPWTKIGTFFTYMQIHGFYKAMRKAKEKMFAALEPEKKTNKN